MGERDFWQQLVEHLAQGDLSGQALSALRRAVLASGQANVLQLGKYNVSIEQGENIQIGDRIYQGPDLETLRRLVRQVQEQIAADSYAASLQEYFLALRTYCANLPYLTLRDIRPPKNLDEVYVPLRAKPRSSPKDNADLLELIQPSAESLSIAEVLRKTEKPHLLILGEPGAGKSTLLRQLAERAWDDPQAIGLSQPHLPMLVPLRKLAMAGGALEECLVPALNKELSLIASPPPGFFRAWKKQMDAPWLLLLDGLDEVPAAARPELIQWLKGMLPLIGAGRLLVTSRPSAYEEREWDEKRFAVYDIQPFTPEQTRAFAEKWFGAEASDFLTALENVHAAELSGTPLLLTIAAKVYLHRKEETGRGSLPERRSQLYEEFINTWLKEAERRGLRAELGDDLTDLAKPTLARLALAMTDDPTLTDEDRLAQVAAEYLGEELRLGKDNAEAKARRFVQVMGRRSGVFLKKNRNYEWLHTTFCECLAAWQLATWWLVKNPAWTCLEIQYKKWSQIALFFLSYLSDWGVDVDVWVLFFLTTHEAGIYIAGLSLTQNVNVNPNIKNFVVDVLYRAAKKGRIEYLQIFPFLKESGSQKLFELAIDSSLKQWIRMSAIRALGTMKETQKLFFLSERRDFDTDLRIAAAFEIGKLGYIAKSKEILLSAAQGEEDFLVIADLLPDIGAANEAKSIIWGLVQNSANPTTRLVALLLAVKRNFIDLETALENFTSLMLQVDVRTQKRSVRFLVQVNLQFLQLLLPFTWEQRFSVELREELVRLAYQNSRTDLVSWVIKKIADDDALFVSIIEIAEEFNDIVLLESLSKCSGAKSWIQNKAKESIQRATRKIEVSELIISILGKALPPKTTLDRPEDLELIRETRISILENDEIPGRFRILLMENFDTFLAFDDNISYYLPAIQRLSNSSDSSIRHAAREAIARIRQRMEQSEKEDDA